MIQVFLLYFSLTGFLIGDIPRAIWGLIAVLLTFLPAIMEWRLHMHLPWTVKFLIALSLFLHIAGGINRWYFLYYPFYDKIAHFVAALTIAFMLYLFLLCLGTYSRLKLGRFTIMGIILVSTMLFGQAWEYAELSIDMMVKSTYYMSGLDSVIDTTGNFLGAFIIVVIAYYDLKKSPVADVFNRYVQW